MVLRHRPPQRKSIEETTPAVAQEEQEETLRNSLTVLVVQESECRSVWAYAVEHKGSKGMGSQSDM